MKNLMVEVEDGNERTKHITDDELITIRVFLKRDGDHLLMRDIKVMFSDEQISYEDEQFEFPAEVKDEMQLAGE